MVRRALAFALVVLLVSAGPSSAQYFGRNKVHYARLDFRIFETPHFDVYYYPAEASAAAIAARMAERWYDQLSRAFDHRLAHRQPIILYDSHAKFAQTSILPDFVPEGVGGFTDHLAGRVVLPFAAGFGDTDHVLGHELVHAFQRDILKQRGRSLAMLPLWFSEGMAEALSVKKIDTNTLMWLRDSATSGLPTIAQLDDPKWFPYRYGQALWLYLEQRYGQSVVAKALFSKRARAAERLQEATGRPAAELSGEWHAYVKQLAGASRSSGTPITPIIQSGLTGGRMNLAPALSPDGKEIVFLSERDGFSVDLYLADAATGTVRSRLLSTATDAHFDSLQFLESAGSWSPSGGAFVLATVRDGEAQLTILSMPGGTVSREISVPDVDQIFGPTWSPDGNLLAFAGAHGGIADLYVLDLTTGHVRQLTSDFFSDLQPGWSPDGTKIVFSTDRFTSAPDALVFGEYRLATIDIATGHIDALPSMAGAKNVNPVWSADGRTIFFISDADSTSNVYRLELATARIEPVTDVANGVSGLTSLSPALAVARDNRLAFSVYRRGVYEIDGVAASDPVPLSVDAPLPARTIGPLASSPDSGGALFTTRKYRRSLSLASVGEPYLSAGGGAFGSFLRAGISLSFSDVLGEQQLDTALQVGKSATDFAVQTAYVNRRSRWTWGVIAGQVPAITGLSTTPLLPSASTLVRDQREDDQLHRQLSGIVSYPFSRAQRIEFSAGVDAVSFSQKITHTVYSAEDGHLLSDATTVQHAIPSATVVATGAALVYDTAVIGPTSPIVGQRYRFGVSPTLGDIHVTTTVADYRRYFMPVRPLTLAFRVEHFARFGDGTSDPRLFPLVWVLRDIVRGYDSAWNDVYASTRFAAANIELRAPLGGLLHRGMSYGTLPIEVFGFSDLGRFWSPANPATSLRSAGAGVRINAAGFILEIAAARPFDPITGAAKWRLAINFHPGF